jgi:hypothetical protein
MSKRLLWLDLEKLKKFILEDGDFAGTNCLMELVLRASLKLASVQRLDPSGVPAEFESLISYLEDAFYPDGIYAAESELRNGYPDNDPTRTKPVKVFLRPRKKSK